MSADRDILVISDLHLGEDLRPGSDADVGLDTLEGELVAFLEHYGGTASGRSWQLVVNGDMVDLVSASLMPHQTGQIIGLPAEDHHYGLGSRAGSAASKVRAVVARHDRFFRAMAGFVGRGHDVAMVLGNHDAELHWPLVQQVLVDELLRRWQEDPTPGRTDDAFRDAISFHPWFWFEEGSVWVEHGHQYDGYCSFDYVLDPADPTLETELEQNLGSAALRYIGNHMMSQPEDEADRSFVEYVKLIWYSGQGWLLWSGYWTMAWVLGQQWVSRLRRPEAFEARRERHQEMLRALALRSRLTEETLHKLFELRTRPVFLEFSRLMRALMLGRLLLSLGALALIPILVLTLPWLWQPVGFAAVALVLLAAHVLLAVGREDVDPTRAMERAAQAIGDLVKAPVVVFGHSHHAAATRLGDGGWYFNTGTWLGEPGRIRSFTHLLIERGPQGVTARLCRWIDGQSRELRAELARFPAIQPPAPPGRRPGL